MKKFIQHLNEYHTDLEEITIYDGYTLYLTKVDSCNSGITWFEISSSRVFCPRPYETLEEAMKYINDWKAELKG